MGLTMFLYCVIAGIGKNNDPCVTPITTDPVHKWMNRPESSMSLWHRLVLRQAGVTVMS